MKISFTIFFLAMFSFLLSLQSANACSISSQPLRKQFREADAVFTGKVSKIIEYTPSEKEILLVPENWREWKVWSKVTFEVTKKYKGNISKTQEFISVAWYICGCSTTASEFKEGQDYLIFSQGKSFVGICNSEEIASDTAKKEIEQIDNFGFRLWSRIYPF
jgi:hypothetical protein